MNYNATMSIDNKVTSRNPGVWYLVALLVFILGITSGYLVYQFMYSLQPKPQTAKTYQEDGLTWKKYTYKSNSALSFNYPEGGQITEPTAQTKYHMLKYNDLEMKVEIHQGVSPDEKAPTEKYTIVTGNYKEGIGKITGITENGLIPLRYFYYENGGQSTGYFIKPNISISFIIPTIEETEYTRIADKIAVSFRELPVKVEQQFTKTYITPDYKSVILVRGKNEIDDVSMHIATGKELVYSTTINEAGTYLVITNNIINSSSGRLFVYDTIQNKLISFGGKNVNTTFLSPEWVDNNVFLDVNEEGCFQYSISELKREKVPEETCIE